MLKQSWSVARVILSLPAVFKRTGEAYELPEWLLKKNASLRFSVCASPFVHFRSDACIFVAKHVFCLTVGARSSTVLEVHRCEDMGPGTHLLNGLKLETDPFTLLVVVDDDHVSALIFLACWTLFIFRWCE